MIGSQRVATLGVGLKLWMNSRIWICNMPREVVQKVATMAQATK